MYIGVGYVEDGGIFVGSFWFVEDVVDVGNVLVVGVDCVDVDVVNIYCWCVGFGY